MVIDRLKNHDEILWVNEDIKKVDPLFELNGKKFVHIKAAQNRLMRFMPYIEKVFPETKDRRGIIESNLIEAQSLREKFHIAGKVFIKDDAHLPIAGSVKARGGIYEVLKIAEELAIKEGYLNPAEDHSVIDSDRFKKLYGNYTIQVGSTGNLGLSIGIMSAKLGFNVIVHMSNDAKQWKKDLLREVGVNVKEYESDYTQAVENGRKLSESDPNSYFIDDENSEDLFMGYATAALRLKRQLERNGVAIDENNPLFVYIPCGVGGAPGGITFGLKQLFGSSVYCFFAEPVSCPCFTLGMASKKYNDISVYDIGLSGKTIADGLAVGKASGFVCNMMKPLVSGSFTVSDEKLLEYQRYIDEKEGIFLEPSACAGVDGLDKLFSTTEGNEYLNKNGLSEKTASITHIVWATGGGLAQRYEVK